MSPPEPVRPPYSSAKANAFLMYSSLSIVATFCLITMPPGAWRLLAVITGLLAGWFGVVAVRAQKRHDQTTTDR